MIYQVTPLKSPSIKASILTARSFKPRPQDLNRATGEDLESDTYDLLRKPGDNSLNTLVSSDNEEAQVKGPDDKFLNTKISDSEASEREKIAKEKQELRDGEKPASDVYESDIEDLKDDDEDGGD